MSTKWMVRKRSQRRVPSLSGRSCEKCGSTKTLQRHHPDYSKDIFIVLCRDCHIKTHVEDGTWGTGPKQTKNCVICGKQFLPNHSKKHSTCSGACLKRLGRYNALKRWHPQKAKAMFLGFHVAHLTESKDLKPSAMQSSPKSWKS